MKATHCNLLGWVTVALRSLANPPSVVTLTKTHRTSIRTDAVWKIVIAQPWTVTSTSEYRTVDLIARLLYLHVHVND